MSKNDTTRFCDNDCGPSARRREPPTNKLTAPLLAMTARVLSQHSPQIGAHAFFQDVMAPIGAITHKTSSHLETCLEQAVQVLSGDRWYFLSVFCFSNWKARLMCNSCRVFAHVYLHDSNGIMTAGSTRLLLTAD